MKSSSIFYSTLQSGPSLWNLAWDQGPDTQGNWAKIRKKVQFWEAAVQSTQCLAQRLKINVFLNVFEHTSPKGAYGVLENKKKH